MKKPTRPVRTVLVQFLFATVMVAILSLACSSGSTVSGKDTGDNTSRDISGETVFPDVPPDVPVPTDWRAIDVQWDIPQAECVAGQGHFGCPCVGADDCLSGWCQLHLGDMVCTQVCVTECPEGFSCVTVGATDPVSICTSLYPSLCLPCGKNEDCQGVAARCLNYGDESGSFCGQDCLDSTECPVGYECTDGRTLTGAVVKACVIAGMECPCTQYATGAKLKTECSRRNTHGICPGIRECTPEGLSACDAPVPEPETCDGVDNNCNGATDEGILCDDGNECTHNWCDGTNGCRTDNHTDPCTDDGIFCTLDVCLDGICTHPPLENGTLCDDGDPCTLDDQCQEGTCEYGRLNPICQDICGDGVCAVMETWQTCPVDCGYCGDGICSLHELKKEDGQLIMLCPLDCLPICGDGKCQGGESVENCPTDCWGCGDGACSYGESFDSCAADCPPACGNGICEMFETPFSCPPDCLPACGNGICHTGQSPATCPMDCPLCGDGFCAYQEDKDNCPMDCETACGNGICEGGESAENCPVDCGSCNDGVCGYHETPDTCPADCFIGCGDGVCVNNETCYTCPIDCGLCCGNGVCDEHETCATCSLDCGKCPGEACSGATECQSGFCVDGVCCDKACSGTCMSCAVSGMAGQCILYGNNSDPEGECGLCRVCNGAGGCSLVALGNDPLDQCEPVCDNSILSLRHCGGYGSCVVAGSSSCGNYACATDGRSCRTSCYDNDHCLSVSSCYNTKCLTWQDPPPEETMYWNEAVAYCTNLSTMGGGWRLPSIGELRSLIRGCALTETGGLCNVEVDDCLPSQLDYDTSVWPWQLLSCIDESCFGCSPLEGPADGCYWSVDLHGSCSQQEWAQAYYYSSDTAYTSPFGALMVYSVHFGAALVWLASGADLGFGTDYSASVRCVKSPD